MAQERRKFRRAKVKLDAQMNYGGKTISVITRNISCSGMLVEASDAIDEFTLIGITLEIPKENGGSERLSVEGVVVRSEIGTGNDLPYGLALHFINIEENVRAKIRAFVEETV